MPPANNRMYSIRLVTDAPCWYRYHVHSNLLCEILMQTFQVWDDIRSRLCTISFVVICIWYHELLLSPPTKMLCQLPSVVSSPLVAFACHRTLPLRFLFSHLPARRQSRWLFVSVDDWDCCWPLWAEYLASRDWAGQRRARCVAPWVDWRDADRRRWCGSVERRGLQTKYTVSHVVDSCTSHWTGSSAALTVSSCEYSDQASAAAFDVAVKRRRESDCRFHPSSACRKFAILPVATVNQADVKRDTSN